jgi:hypothetical protein
MDGGEEKEKVDKKEEEEEEEMQVPLPLLSLPPIIHHHPSLWLRLIPPLLLPCQRPSALI